MSTKFAEAIKKTNNSKTEIKEKNSDSERMLNSKVEQYYLEKSQKLLRYEPTEKSSIIQVDNFPELGKLTALRFIEWVQENPNGVVSLPTGKTPEHFIKWVEKIVKEWDSKFVKNELAKVGLDSKNKPRLDNLKFVQIDEFYPIDSNQHNSFYYYIKKYYFKNLGLDPSKALFININKIPLPGKESLKEIFPDNKVDLSLRTRFASNKQERLQKRCIELVDEFCTNYERKIREMGGIDFLLGGIGPDGHIGFNVKGSDHFSTTRLIPTNYETQSAAASDLGGMEIARNRLVITIGLKTITYNKDAVAIIIAAGESKGNIVRDSVQNGLSNEYPATALQELPNARFFLTKGAAFRLTERRYVDIDNTKKIPREAVDRALINLAVKTGKRLTEFSNADYKNDKIASLVLKKTDKPGVKLGEDLTARLIKRLEKGIAHVENEVILHTAPHHDDIMLGYLHYINHLVRNPSNKHHFSYFTSGFTAVTNDYMLKLLRQTKEFVDQGYFDERFQSGYFDPNFIEGKNRDISLYLDGISARSRTIKREALSRRIIRNMIEIYEEDNPKNLNDRLDELINYFSTQYPGKKDIPHVQKLKGMQREWEVEILWGPYGFGVTDVTHLRLGFYQGDIFTETPKITRDVLPVLSLFEKIKPTVIGVALDPESSGPDTHYKVMQVIAEALRMYQEKYNVNDIKVWGYRNVWSRFHPCEANLYVPISLNSFAIMEKSFMNSFGSQKNASFPSWEHDGPFHELAQKIQVHHYNTIRTCLGNDYFLNNVHPRLKAAKGLLMLKELTLNEFYKYSIDLKKVTENV
ncbi:MAG: glucosamine-6-phosphate deaminase [Ignavibacteria bacterium]|jgi:glucosamine-6-phosphate deaminase